jgi:probable HAF family extracellular repeat protein
MNRMGLFAAVVSLPLCAATLAATPPQYSVVDLGVLQPGEGLPWRGVVGTPAAANFQELGTTGGLIYATNGITSVGSSGAPSGNKHAVKWFLNSSNQTEMIADFGLLPGALTVGSTAPTSAALSFNNSGDVVGYSTSANMSSSASTPQAATHAVMWHDGVINDLGAIAGNGYNSSAEGFNDSSEIVGTTNTISSATQEVLNRAFISIDGTMYNLTFYLVGGPQFLLSDATAIDCQGNISATGTAAAGGSTHTYLLLRQGAARSCSQ